MCFYNWALLTSNVILFILISCRCGTSKNQLQFQWKEVQIFLHVLCGHIPGGQKGIDHFHFYSTFMNLAKFQGKCIPLESKPLPWQQRGIFYQFLWISTEPSLFFTDCEVWCWDEAADWVDWRRLFCLRASFHSQTWRSRWRWW